MRVEGTQEEIDSALERLEMGDTATDVKRKFEEGGCHVRMYP